MSNATFFRKTKTTLLTGTFLAAFLATTALPIFSNLPSAHASTDTYPTSIAGCSMVTPPPTGTFSCDLKDSTQDLYADPWSEWNRECISYATWMLSSVNGFTMPFHAEATLWGSKAQALGYTVNMTPAVGSIFWSSSIDHVGWVESVSPNGSTINYLDYNFGLNGLWSEHIGVATSSASGYIHFKDLPTPYHYQPFAADFNGDGYADIGLYDRNIGMFYIKHGPSFSDQITYQWAAGVNYQPFVGDFNHDGYADIGLRDVNTGMIYIKHGPSFGDQVTYQWAAGANYQVLAADFNADGYADIGLRDMNSGMFYIKHGPSFSDQVTYQWATGSNYVPLAADFNGDGYADIGLYDQYAGMFYIKHGTGFSDQVTYQWAAGSNYQPYAADFNADGYADIGLRDANIGMFYIKHGTSFGDQVTYQWVGG